ncbi:MAG TPA: O-antigen ligase family protein [Chitinophaga sp.]|nr:O-antigen ligase family protein [Chitinophaga sp.]
MTFIVVCILIAIVPTIYAPYFADATQSTKLIVSLFLLAITAGLCVIRTLCSDNVNIRLSALDTCLLLLFIYLLLNRFISAPHAGFSMQLYELTALAGLYILIRTFPAEYLSFLLLAIALAGGIQGLHGLLQLSGITPSLHNSFPVTGSFFNPGPYAGFMAVTGVLASGIYLYSNELTSKGKSLFSYISLAALISAVVILPALRSRAAWIGFAIGGAYLLAYRYNIRNRIARMSVPGKYLAGVSLVIFLTAALYSAYGYKKQSADGRMLIYQVSAGIFKQHPLTGIGFDRFGSFYMDAQASMLRETGNILQFQLADNTYYAFSEPLHFLVENGITGMMLLLALFIALVRMRVTEENMLLKQLCLSVLLAGFAFGLFAYPSYILSIKIIMITALAILAHIEKDTVHQVNTNVAVPAMLTCLVATASGALLSVHLFMGFRNWKLARNSYENGLYEECMAEYKAAYPVLKHHGDFLMQYGKALSMAGKYDEAISILEQARQQLNNTIIETALGDSYKGKKDYRAAEKAYLQAENMVPGRFYPAYLLMKLYDAAGQKDKALQKAEEILSKSIKVPSKAVEEIKAAAHELINSQSTASTLIIHH